jgi:outer membrane lipoprotein-sorting protein
MNNLTPHQLAKLQAAHEVFDHHHAAERSRLLAALPVTMPTERPSRWRKSKTMFQNHWTKGMLAAILVIALASLWQVVQPTPLAFAQVSNAMQTAKGFTCEMFDVRNVDGNEIVEPVGRMVVSATGDYRLETRRENGKLLSTIISRMGKPGIEMDLVKKTYQIHEPDLKPSPYFTVIGALTKYTGKADNELGRRRIGNVKAKGYALTIKNLSRDFTDLPASETMEVWIDPSSSRPLRIDLQRAFNPGLIRFDNFTWGNVDEQWFDTTSPKDYQNETTKAETTEEITETIILGLKAYAKYTGHYPQVKIIHPNSTRDEVFKAAGFSRSPSRSDPVTDAQFAEMDTPKWRELSNASRGFYFIQNLQDKNPGAAYYGKRVKTTDVGKVLFRWKLAAGDYHVIFSDLKAATVSAEKLAILEK